MIKELLKKKYVVFPLICLAVSILITIGLMKDAAGSAESGMAMIIPILLVILGTPIAFLVGWILERKGERWKWLGFIAGIVGWYLFPTSSKALSILDFTALPLYTSTLVIFSMSGYFGALILKSGGIKRVDFLKELKELGLVLGIMFALFYFLQRIF